MRIAWGLIVVGTYAVIACDSGTEPVEDNGGPGTNGSGASGSGASGSGANGSGGSGAGVTQDPRDMCEAQCGPNFPNGAADYDGLRQCTLCRACFNSCTAESATACPNGGQEIGCSQVGDCATCVADSCTLDEQPGPIYMGACANEATLCSMNMDCLRMIDCVSDCITATMM